jgi:hypothetical protein
VSERSDAERQAVAVRCQDGRFAGKVAFVTGLTSDIGRATALAFGRTAPASSSPTLGFGDPATSAPPALRR